jgi:hypothetical protein
MIALGIKFVELILFIQILLKILELFLTQNIFMNMWTIYFHKYEVTGS